MRNILSLPLLLLMSFISLKPSQKIKQGICGIILLKQGNQMPSPGRAPSSGQPVIRDIAIYKLTNLSEAKNNGGVFTEVKTVCVAKTTSNAKGYFEVALPAGQYTVFIVEKEGLYANNFNGKGSINTVEVLKNSVTRKDISISNKAIF